MLFPLMTRSLMMSWKLDCRSQKQKWSNQRQCLIPGLVIGLFFRFFFRLWKSSFHWNIVNRVKQNGKQWNWMFGFFRLQFRWAFDSIYDSNFLFDWVINTLMTPTTTLAMTPLDYEQSLFFLSPWNKMRKNAYAWLKARDGKVYDSVASKNQRRGRKS